MRQLTFIWHDCFVYEDNSNVFIFDFWRDPEDDGVFLKFLTTVDSSKNIFVIVSHHHKDHFNKKIFEWEKIFPSITFVLSKDVEKNIRYLLRENTVYQGPKPNIQNIRVLKRGEVLEEKNVRISAYSSTDIGNSYVVESEGKRIFHAGDLNAWIWKDESSEKEINEALKKYNYILDEIFANFKTFDFAMFPVDKRIGTDYFEGAKIFVRKFDVGYFVPMHFCLWENETQKKDFISGALDFKNYANPERGIYIGLSAPYGSFYVPD